MTQDEIKQVLSRIVEAEIGDLVAWGSQADGVTLTDIEDRVLAARQRIGQALTRGLIEQQEQRRDAEIPVNAQTGQRLHPKGAKRGRSSRG